MSISDIYPSGKHKQEVGHFANIVKIAKADGNISNEEEIVLNRASKNLNITPEEYAAIIENPEKFPINPPIDYDERIERLYRLAKMILADGEVAPIELKLMEKIAVGLNFSSNNSEKICETAVSLVLQNNDLDDFTSAIKKVNKSDS
ncbi:fructose 1,6-bisphosphatase [Polaribacter tangerinus]|uniref:fructose 1,6-bisphosphatase n=1 Tax=Polaribacter tangerinus TaxID=1920034 RepID=UPI000B4BF125|nr:fructose 1,6-bisphosphatase [Polaribacter tangerinus]